MYRFTTSSRFHHDFRFQALIFQGVISAKDSLSTKKNISWMNNSPNDWKWWESTVKNQKYQNQSQADCRFLTLLWQWVTSGRQNKLVLACDPRSSTIFSQQIFKTPQRSTSKDLVTGVYLKFKDRIFSSYLDISRLHPCVYPCPSAEMTGPDSDHPSFGAKPRGFDAHRIDGTGIFTYMKTYKNQPFM